MCHQLHSDLELELALAQLLRIGEQEADELTRSFRAPIPNREPSKDQKMDRKMSEQPEVVPI